MCLCVVTHLSLFRKLCIFIFLSDWLIKPLDQPVSLVESSYSTIDGHKYASIVFSNGLISRTFAVQPAFGCIDFYSHMTNTSFIRNSSTYIRAAHVIHMNAMHVHTFDVNGRPFFNSCVGTLKPEASITLDSILYNIGELRLVTNINQTASYLDRDELAVSVDTSAWTYVSYSISAPKAPFKWIPGTRFSPKTTNWPPKGIDICLAYFHYAGTIMLINVRV